MKKGKGNRLLNSTQRTGVDLSNAYVLDEWGHFAYEIIQIFSSFSMEIGGWVFHRGVHSQMRNFVINLITIMDQRYSFSQEFSFTKITTSKPSSFVTTFFFRFPHFVTLLSSLILSCIVSTLLSLPYKLNLRIVVFRSRVSVWYFLKGFLPSLEILHPSEPSFCTYLSPFL